eukprot:10501221-Lingulodinium_polyedra.AAC.1
MAGRGEIVSHRPPAATAEPRWPGEGAFPWLQWSDFRELPSRNTGWLLFLTPRTPVAAAGLAVLSAPAGLCLVAP